MSGFREWQNEQYDDFVQSVGQVDKKWYMLVATPGAGKTTAMLRCATHYLSTGQANFIVIVVPSLGLKKQWKQSALNRFNLQFMESFQGYATDEFDGVIVTYQQLAANPEAIRQLHRGRSIFAILDEPHHMGELRSWGQGVQHALDKCVRGIMGSGTLFRTDNVRIPLVPYDTTGQSAPHYVYGYEDALIDQICRAVFFRKLDVRAEWLSYNEELVTATFYDHLPERQATERLNTTLDPTGNWMKDVIQQAVNELRIIRREEQPNAGLLIITKDTIHAEQVANLYRSIAGLEPVIVSSDKEAGHGGKDDIELFAKSDEECIISVAMVSEGVDIPRLRSLVYATNKLTELFFRQAIGRIVRVEKGKELLNGLCYIPSDTRLLEMAHAIKQERNHVIENVEDRIFTLKKAVEEDGEAEEKSRRTFTVISTQAVDDGGVYDAESYPPTELSAASEWIKKHGLRIPVEEGAKIRRLAGHEVAQVVPLAVEDLEEKREMLSRKADRLAFRYAKLREHEGFHVKDVHVMWMREQRGKPQKQETINGLERKIAWLNKLIEKHS